MTKGQNPSERHALVSVFDDLESAKTAVEELHRGGFDLREIELLTARTDPDGPHVETPSVRKTTASSLAGGAMRGAGVGVGLGAGFGIAALVLTASPGIFLGSLVYAGLAGAYFGGMGGIDEADRDDSVNLPTREEYHQFLDAGKCLVIVCGTHEQLQRAHRMIQHIPMALSHLHRIRGHVFHEHPRLADI